ncbi:hypothetical protein ABMA59_31185 [Mesorhizobium sp. CN2-181]
MQAPIGLILRMPAYLPQTAGGQRLGRELGRAHHDQLCDDIVQHLMKEEIDEIPPLDPIARAAGEEPAEYVRKTVPDLHAEIQAVADATVQYKMLDDFDLDIGALIFEIYNDNDQEFSTYKLRIDAVVTVYRNFIHLYLYEQSHPNAVSPYRTPMPKWFESRADVFRKAALASFSVDQLYSVLAGLAADVSAFGLLGQGPLSMARAQVGALFEDGISPDDLDAIGRLYESITQSLIATSIWTDDPDDLDARLDLMREDFVPDYLKQDVLNLEKKLAGDADDKKRADFHQELAEEIAFYLATVLEDDYLPFTDEHIARVRDILKKYGGSQLVVIFYADVWFPWEDFETAGEQQDTDQSKSRTGAGGQTTQSGAPRVSTAPAEPVCDGEVISQKEIHDWLVGYLKDSSSFSDRWKDANGLICANRAYTSQPSSPEVAKNLKAMTDEALLLMRQLKTHLDATRLRANAIGYARMGDVAGPIAPNETPQAQRGEEPDTVALLRYDSRFLEAFRSALQIYPENYDLTHTVDDLTDKAFKHFEAMIYYQQALKDAVVLWRGLVKDGMDVYLRGFNADTYGPPLDQLKEYAESKDDFPDWPSRQMDKDVGQPIDFSVAEMKEMAARGKAERDLDSVEAIQAEVFYRVPLVATEIRTDEIGSENDTSKHDMLGYDEVWKLLEPQLDDGWQKYQKDTADAVKAAIELVNQDRLTALAKFASQMASLGDAQSSEAAMERFRSLRYRIMPQDPVPTQDDGTKAARDDLISKLSRDDPTARFTEAVQMMNTVATQHLVQLFLVSEAALKYDSQPGRVMREVNLLLVLLERSPQKTLHGAVNELNTDFLAQMLVSEGAKTKEELLKGSDLGPWDTLAQLESSAFMASSLAMGDKSTGLIQQAIDDVNGSMKPGGVLSILLQAENAGGIEDRAPFFGDLGQLLREHGTTQSLTSARFIYADILGVADLIDEMGMPPKVSEAQTRRNKRMTNPGWVPEPGPDGKAPPSMAEDAATIEDYEARQSLAFEALDQGYYPDREECLANPRPLTSFDQIIWERYKEITGRDSFGPSPISVSKAKDFGKQVLKMAAVLLVTRGLGARFFAAAGIAEGGTLATIAQMGAFTAFMRAESSLSTGRYPHTSFLEDMIVNLATEGVGRGTQIGYRMAFGLGGSTAKLSVAHTAGMFAAEIATTSVASMITAGVAARIFDRPFTDAEMESTAMQNAAMMVAMRGVHVLGARATEYMQVRLAEAQLKERVKSIDLAALQREMQVQDAAIKDAAKSMLDDTTDAERLAHLDEQLVAMRRKLDILGKSKDPEVRILKESYRLGVEMHQRAVMQARLHVGINARPSDRGADMTFAPGPESERLLSKHLAQNNVPFTVREGLSGRVFEVTLPNGRKMRYRPRPELAGGASREGAYTGAQRSPGKPLSAADPMSIMNVVLRDGLHHPLIPDNGTNRFEIGAGDTKISVTLVPVEKFSESSTRHKPGPATFDVRYENGKLVATIEVMTNRPDEQITRAVNEEVVELQRISQLLASPEAMAELKPGTPGEQLKQLVLREASAGMLGKDTPGGRPTADDISTLQSIEYLGKKLAQLTAKINNPATREADRPDLYAARALILSDFQALWKEAHLSTSKEGLAATMKTFEDAGVPLSQDTRGFLEGMRFTKAGHPLIDAPVDMLDLHIIFSELQKANPNLMAGVTIRDFMNYYHEAVARKAKANYDEALKEGKTPEQARDIMKETILTMSGGTSIASHRGRAFEGMSMEDFNANPALVQQYGRMIGFEQNNYPTYDTLTVKGAVNGFTMHKVTKPNAKGVVVDHIVLMDADGTTFFECYRGSNGGILWDSPPTRYDVLKWSMKARSTVDTYQVLKATGFTKPAQAVGRMFLSTEGMAALKAKAAWYSAEVARYKAMGANKAGHPQHNQYRLTLWRERLLNRVAGQTGVGRSNASIDATIEALRLESLDPNEVVKQMAPTDTAKDPEDAK